MALITCHECGKQVSTEAKNCPSCGAKIKLPKKPTSKWVWALLTVVGITMIIGVGSQDAEREAARKAEAAMTPEQAAQAKARKDKETKTMALAMTGANALKKSAKDPQTFEFTSIVTHPNSTVCYEYRAKNSFNAILQGEAVVTEDGRIYVRESSGNEFVRAWNKNCTRADGTNVTRLVERLL